MAEKQLIVFTDLDGTLLDHHSYSFQPAVSGLKLIKQHQIPLIICTSKTRAEIENWQRQLDIKQPFISENGGAVYIPRDYFSFNYSFDKQTDDYEVLTIGEPVSKLRGVLHELQLDYDITQFSTLPDAQVASMTNMPIEQAHLAKQREYDLPFLIKDASQEETIKKFIIKQGFNYTKGGRFSHIIGNADKGKAVKKLLHLFNQQYQHILTIGIGDSDNDFPMLKTVDIGFLVQKPNGRYASRRFQHVRGKGPQGWNAIITNLVEKQNY